jgi:hypothetical protein
MVDARTLLERVDVAALIERDLGRPAPDPAWPNGKRNEHCCTPVCSSWPCSRRSTR